MNILVVHNKYQQRGGEDAVVEAEMELLANAGHSINVAVVSNDGVSGLPAKARTFLRTPYNAARKSWLNALLAQYRPDVVHIHNFFPLLTPAIHEAASEHGSAVVQTLHNYRLLCAGALFLREGHVCEKCLHGSSLWGVIHRCYRGSLPGSLAVTRMQARAKRSEVWKRHVHRFIALTEFAREKFIEGGLPAERIAVKPNFVAPPQGLTMLDRNGAIYVGRLSVEKGVKLLLEAWRSFPHIPLTIVGDGPERHELEAVAPANVTFTGALSGSEVRSRMAQAQCLIMPSIWYETFGLTIIEAFSVGTPVLASRLGAMAELIDAGVTGLTFEPNETHLIDAIRAAFSDSDRLLEMGRAATGVYNARYTPKANLAQLEKIYEGAIATSKLRQQSQLSTRQD